MRPTALLLVLLAVTTAALAHGASPPVETHVVDTGRAPCGTTVADGAVWVGVYETGKLLRLDPESARVTRRVTVGSWACRIAIAGDVAWVTRDRAGVLARIDLRTGRRKAFEVGALPFDVIRAFGSIWVTSFQIGTIARLDSASSRLTRVYKIAGSNPAGITRCGGRIWVGHGRAATWLTSIHPTTHRMRRVEVGTQAPGWPRCVRGELWVTSPTHVLRLEARGGRVLGRTEIGGTPAEAAAGPDGLVWVTDKERSLVHRIDPASATVVDSFPAGPGAFSLARMGDAMWITSFAGADVRRYSP
jgi:streptogramin lyase